MRSLSFQDALNYSKLLKIDTQRLIDDRIYNEELHQAKNLRYFENQQSLEKFETFEKSRDMERICRKS